MLLPSTELMLMAFAVALYLYDSLVPLFVNEGILSPVGRDRWQVEFASDRFQWRGKELFLPNPLAPHRPIYRLCWATHSWDVAERSEVTPCRSYGLLVPLTWVMAFAVFVLLPLGLFSRFGDVMIVATLICFYVAALSALGYLWCYRERFQCSKRSVAHLAFESLTCPPFALNLIRHLSLAQSPPADLAHMASQLQSSDDWAETRERLACRIESAMSWESSPDVLDQHKQYIDWLRKAPTLAPPYERNDL